MLALTSAFRRRFFHHHCHLRLYSTPSAANSIASHTPSDLSVVKDSVFRSESDPKRAISVLFHFPKPSYDRYNCDQALRRLKLDGGCSDLLDSFLPLAVSEKDFASLILSYGTAVLPSRAIRVFRRRLSSSLPVSVLSFNALLSAFIKSKHYKEVNSIFWRILRNHYEKISPDAVSYGLLVQSRFMSKKPQDAFEVLKKNVLTPEIYTLLLVSLKKINNPDSVHILWDLMIDNGVKFCYTDYEIKVWSHATRLETHKLIQVLKEMQAVGYKPSVIMYNSLMVCHCKHGKLNSALELYKAMKEEKDFLLNFDTFNTLLNGLMKIEDYGKGMEVFRDSIRSDMVPNFSILKEFVERLVEKGKIEEAKEVISEGKKKAPPRLSSRWKELEELLGQE